MKKHLLFICTSNEQRSPTAERLFKYSKNYEAKSAGTSSNAETRITSQALEWADLIFVMEEEHKTHIQKNFPEYKNKAICVLEVPDIYLKNDSELIMIIKEKLKTYLKDLEL